MENLKIGTWNVTAISTKKLELINEIEEMKMNITVVTETKKKLKSKEHNDLLSKVSANQRAAKGVVMLTDDKWTRWIEVYTFIDKQIMNVMYRIPKERLVMIGVYAPEEGKKEDTVEFYEIL